MDLQSKSSKSVLHLIEIVGNFLSILSEHQQINDAKGIESIKRQKQCKFIVLVALFYLCTQLLMKSLIFFIVYSSQASATIELSSQQHQTTSQCNEISLVQINWFNLPSGTLLALCWDEERTFMLLHKTDVEKIVKMFHFHHAFDRSFSFFCWIIKSSLTFFSLLLPCIPSLSVLSTSERENEIRNSFHWKKCLFCVYNATADIKRQREKIEGRKILELNFILNVCRRRVLLCVESEAERRENTCQCLRSFEWQDQIFSVFSVFFSVVCWGLTRFTSKIYDDDRRNSPHTHEFYF